MTRYRLDGIGDSALLDTLIHVRSRESAPTAAEVAAEMGIAATVARARLERLVDAGLLAPVFRPQARSGPGSGRPSKLYTVPPEDESIEFPLRHLERLAGFLAGALPQRGRRRRLEEVGRRFGHDLARELRVSGSSGAGTFDRLAAGLRAAGFQVAVESTTESDATLVTPTCPLRPLIAHDPSLRDVDQGMWRGLVERALGAGTDRHVMVACETHGCLDAGTCRITVALQPAGSRTRQ